MSEEFLTPAGGISDTLRRLLRICLRYPATLLWPAAVIVTARGVPMGPPDRRLAWYYLPALGLILLGCFPATSAARARKTQTETFLPRTVLRWAAAAVLAGATLIRLWRLWDWPPNGIGFEEMQIGAGGAAILRNGGLFWGLVRLYGAPSGEHKLNYAAAAVSFRIFGPGIFQMRLPFIVMGILAPFVLYAVCRKLVSREVSIFALILFSVSWWQIAVSRVADEIFFPVTFELAIIWLLLDFRDSGRLWAAFFLALFSGLLLYEYTSYHLVPFLIICDLLGICGVFLVRWVTGRINRPDALAAVRTYAPGAVVLVMVWVIIALLQFVYDIQRPSSYFVGGIGAHAHDQAGLLTQRPADVLTFAVQKLKVPIEAAYEQGKGTDCRYVGVNRYPMFDKATALALGLSLLLVTLTVRRRLHALTLLWSGLVIAGAALLPGNVNIHRYYMALPVLYIVIALGTEVVWRWVRTPGARRVMLAGFLILGAYAAVQNIHHLFWEVMADPTNRLHWVWPRTAVAEWVRQRERTATVWLLCDDDRSMYGADVLMGDWSWLVDGWDVHVSHAGADAIPSPTESHGPLYYLLAYRQPHPEIEALLHKSYPEATPLSPIDVRHHGLTIYPFRIAPPRSNSPAQ